MTRKITDLACFGQSVPAMLQSSAAKLVFKARRRAHVQAQNNLQVLHWLWVQARLDYKWSTIFHNFSESSVSCPSFRSDLLTVHTFRAASFPPPAFCRHTWQWYASHPSCQWFKPLASALSLAVCSIASNGIFSSNIRHIPCFQKWFKGSPLQTIPDFKLCSSFAPSLRFFVVRRLCVCVRACARVWATQRERACVFVCACKRESACVCVCERERLRVRPRARVCERERVRVCVCEYYNVHISWQSYKGDSVLTAVMSVRHRAIKMSLAAIITYLLCYQPVRSRMTVLSWFRWAVMRATTDSGSVRITISNGWHSHKTVPLNQVLKA